MKISTSLAALVATFSATVPTTLPTRGMAAEATGFEWWRLRTTDVATPGTTGSVTGGRQADARHVSEAAAAPERRPVRVVYPGLIAGR